MPKSFTLKFAIVLVAGLAGAVMVAPFAGLAVARAGVRIPFPRIFDRVVMVTLFGAIGLAARGMRLLPRLRAGFADPRGGAARALRGLAVAMLVMAVLFGVAFALGAARGAAFDRGAYLLPKYLASAIVIGILEEGFFRAFLFTGMCDDFGRPGALAASSAVYALAHLVRSPAHFYVTGLDLTAGLRTLAGCGAQLAHPASAMPTLLGLFLLGIVLAEAYVVTGSVYFSIGLHSGFVLGAKLWPKLIAERAPLPGWLAGWGHQPLISGAAAWLAALAILATLRPLSGRRGRAV
ncbi:MAG TPA: CPBP family intramembrane glutamic endopeptidase [Candidatus Binataceae bacterium]|nr:CPBP family intramembrane glutamic endopeptidase [Candidatus Binataceae bacterium]